MPHEHYRQPGREVRLWCKMVKNVYYQFPCGCEHYMIDRNDETGIMTFIKCDMCQVHVLGHDSDRRLLIEDYMRDRPARTFQLNREHWGQTPSYFPVWYPADFAGWYYTLGGGSLNTILLTETRRLGF